MSFFKKNKKIFIVGIGGSGTSALARFLNSKKCSVFGSDEGYNGNLDDVKSEIAICKKHLETNIDKNFDLLIYSSVVSENNPERMKAKELGIKELNYFEALGEISKEFNTIAISGTNGKSTTTALTGMTLSYTDFDPYVILGAGVSGFGFNHNYRMGESNNFVVEACEYEAHMLELFPKIIVLTNIEAEHLDYYRDINHIIDTFKIYIEKLKDNDGVLIYNADCKNTCIVAEYAKSLGIKTFSFGIKEDAKLMAKNIVNENEKQNFDLYFKNKLVEKLSLNVPGDFNISNLLGAIGVFFNMEEDPFDELIDAAQELMIEKIKNVCENFRGIERRFEIIRKDEEKNIIYVLDYAHNPYKISATLLGVKDFYKNRRIVAVFQPHTYDRTKKLFNEFVDSFEKADLIILSEIYEPKGRDEKSDKNISSLDLANSIKEKYNKEVYFTKNLEETREKIEELKKDNDLVIIMGAGDINKMKI